MDDVWNVVFVLFCRLWVAGSIKNEGRTSLSLLYLDSELWQDNKKNVYNIVWRSKSIIHDKLDRVGGQLHG